MGAVYNNLVASYLEPVKRKYDVRDVHKKNELKKYYGDMVSINKKMPLYIVELNDARQKYVLDIKEHSMSLADRIDDLKEQSGSLMSHKKAWTDSSFIDARIITNDYDQLPEDFDISVSQLAQTQRNRGTEYYPDGRGLPGGDYSFKLSVNDSQYKFNYTIKNKAKNIDVMQNLVDYINKANVGVTASVGVADDKKVYLQFESLETGDSGEPIFSFRDRLIDDQVSGIVGYYGINRIVQKSKSAEFSIDGIERHTLSNRFVMNKSLEVSLNDTTDEPVHVGYTLEGKNAFELVENVFDAYNNMVDTSNLYEEETGEHPRLNTELELLLQNDLSEMESVGITYENGHLGIDRYLAGTAFREGDFQKLMAPDGRLLRKLSDKCRAVNLNPMEYVNKRMVTYPDYSKQVFPSAYVSSLYSGMIFNYYC